MINDYQQSLLINEKQISIITEDNLKLKEKILEIENKQLYKESTYLNLEKVKEIENNQIILTNNLQFTLEKTIEKKIKIYEDEIDNLKKLNELQLSNLKEVTIQKESEINNHLSEIIKLNELNNNSNTENSSFRNELNNKIILIELSLQKQIDYENEIKNERILTNQKDNEINSIKNERDDFKDQKIKNELKISLLNKENDNLLNLIKQNEDKISLFNIEIEDLKNLNKHNQNEINLLNFDIVSLNETTLKISNELIDFQKSIEILKEINENQAIIFRNEKINYQSHEKIKDNEINSIKIKLANSEDLNTNINDKLYDKIKKFT